MAALTVAVLTIALLVGTIGHEIAHWLVWRVAGRDPRLDLWKLEVQPRAGPRWTTPADRLAAAAPYLVGGVVLAAGWWIGDLAVLAFGVGVFQLPSEVDVATMRGRTEWRLPEVTDREGSASS